MVREALILPNGAVENVAHRHGDVSIEAVRETYGEAEIERLQRRAIDDEREVSVLAALDRTERERVEEAAAEADQHAAVWLADVTLDEIEDGGPVAGPESVGDLVERAIFKRAPV